MLRIIMLFFVFCGGCFTVFSAFSASCGFAGGNIQLSIPQMAIPADTPDGTVLYTSPKMTKRLNCEVGFYSSNAYPINVFTTASFNDFTTQNNGVKFTVYIDGVPYNREMKQVLGYSSVGNWPVFTKDISIWFDIRVDSSKGKIPISGTLLSGYFESLYFMIGADYGNARGVIGLSTPRITYIPCTMNISISPDTIDFGAVKSSDLEKGTKLQRRFSTLIKKSKGCTLAVSAPFGINMYFEPTSTAINTDGSLNLNNGLGLSISDASGKNIAYNTAWKIDDVKVDSILKNNFSANLQKISGQDIKTGPFSADVVVRMNYY